MITDSKIVDAMSQYGGAFVKALAEAWRRGDSTNRQLIKDTWAVYWERYTELAESRAVEQPATLGTPYGVNKKIVVQSGAQEFLVRRVDVGDHYGAEHCLCHQNRPDEPEESLIEFYLQGAKYPDYDFIGTREDAIAAGADVLGWFVTRYYARTLLDLSPNSGLCLNGGGQYTPAINITSKALNEALAGLGFPTQNLIS